MSKLVLSHLESLESSIRKHAGADIWELVKDDLKSIKENSKLEYVAIKMQEAINTLIKAVDEKAFLNIMFERGCYCANSHMNDIEKKRTEYIKKGSIDEYIDSLVNTKTPGLYYFRDGKELYLAYKTRELKVGCYCPLLRKLSDGALLPQAYCECSRAFVQYTWERVLERNVTVELEGSCMSGKGECRFKITV
ncbi:hypothetical protein [Lutispora saccharofermentans]|uniref:L-2-amino-thiazoline-4-carboxylic acid hydrolase n=1 Tax=Lutispora saccharofermentans TaxID=3024236 RepID=A0ABT1NK52_9FIRM|nr:hypothetical protein [Lutispora saccharofermentans]MCQ1531635.1 hypothetical protein [Lutispora saccharofermentans]